MKFTLIFFFICCAAFTSAKSTGDQTACIQLIEEHLKNVPEGIVDDIFSCLNGVVSAVLDLGEDLIESTNEAVINALKLKEIVLECSEGGTIRQLACIARNLTQLKKTILQVLADAEELVNVLEERGANLVNAVEACNILDSKTKFFSEVLGAQAKQCLV